MWLCLSYPSEAHPKEFSNLTISTENNDPLPIDSGSLQRVLFVDENTGCSDIPKEPGINRIWQTNSDEELIIFHKVHKIWGKKIRRRVQVIFSLYFDSFYFFFKIITSFSRLMATQNLLLYCFTILIERRIFRLRPPFDEMIEGRK